MIWTSIAGLMQRRDAHAVDDVGVLRRERRPEHQARRSWSSTAKSSTKRRRVLHHRVGAVAEELLVEACSRSGPRGGERSHAAAEGHSPQQRCRAGRCRPRGRCCGGRRSRGSRSGRVRSRRRDAEPVEQVEERLVTLRQVRDLGRPVVHLRVDVDRELAVPRRDVAVVPDPLQVRRQRPGAARAEQQVAPELEDEREQAGVVASVA